MKPGDTIRMMATGAEFTLVEVGHMVLPTFLPVPSCRLVRSAI